MSDTTTVNANPYNRPMARITEEGKLEVRASALGRCRRALWYAATEQPITNPTSPESLTIMESGNALEPVVIRAMQRAGWTIHPIDRDAPTSVLVPLKDNLVVSGHPDATGLLPNTNVSAIDSFLFDDSPPAEGDELVIEVKTRGPEAFKRWQMLGAERSHPDSVAQAACYSLGLFGEHRDGSSPRSIPGRVAGTTRPSLRSVSSVPGVAPAIGSTYWRIISRPTDPILRSCPNATSRRLIGSADAVPTSTPASLAKRASRPLTTATTPARSRSPMRTRRRRSGATRSCRI